MKSIENKILELFLFNNKLRFNEIGEQLNIRSNKLSYHLKSLIKKEILIKEKENYSLSSSAEYLIPYLSDKKANLPVVLIHIGNNTSCFLYNRKKRPFKGYLSLPGGRLLINESIKQATKRIAKKFNINANLIKINSISIEHVKKSNNKIHSFLLIFVSAKTNDKITLTNIKNNKSKIISSDYQLLIKDLNKSTIIKTIYSKP